MTLKKRYRPIFKLAVQYWSISLQRYLLKKNISSYVPITFDIIKLLSLYYLFIIYSFFEYFNLANSYFEPKNKIKPCSYNFGNKTFEAISKVILQYFVDRSDILRLSKCCTTLIGDRPIFVCYLGKAIDFSNILLKDSTPDSNCSSRRQAKISL